MSPHIYNIDEIDFNKIIYSKSFMYNKKISSINVAYLDNNRHNPLLIQLPSLYSDEGIYELCAKAITHELPLSIVCKTEELTIKVKQFLNSLDTKFMNDYKIKKYTWDTDNELVYKMLVRKSDNEDRYPNGIFKIKFIKSNDFSTSVYYKNRKTIHVDEYRKAFNDKCYVKIILECVSLWRNRNVFGLYLRPHQIRVDYIKVPKSILHSYAFSLSSTDDSKNNVANISNNDTSNGNEVDNVMSTDTVSDIPDDSNSEDTNNSMSDTSTIDELS